MFRSALGLLPALLIASAGCSSIGSSIDRLPVDAAARGYVMLPKPVTLPRSRLTAECVPESVCAVMNYWGKSATVEELSFYGRTPNLNGMLSTQVPVLARQKGFKATFLEGSVGKIKNAIDRGVPPIIGVQSGGGNYHCFVVIGYNDKEQTLVCEEYNDTKRLISYEEVEVLWQPSGHLMLELEVSRAEELFADGAGQEAKGRYGEAAALYRKALKLDPKFYEARLGLGNCLLFQQKLEEALVEYKLAFESNSADPKVCNNLANVYLELKRELPEAERLAGLAVERYGTAAERAREAMDQERQPALRALRQSEFKDAELDLADALGTLGQARAANDRHELAIAAWKAARDHYPLTEFDSRAKRLLEIARSCRALNMPAEARRHLEIALREARDPALRSKIEAAMK
jgi:tetratricopeptide (TPR) repeat protein